MKKNLLILLLFLSFLGCDKTTEFKPNVSRETLVEDVQEWYKDSPSISSLRNERDLNNIEALWSQSKVYHKGGENYLVRVPLINRSPNRFSSLQLLAFRSKDKIKGFILEVITSGSASNKLTSKENGFTGQVKVLSKTGKKIRTFKFEKGRQVEFYKNATSTLRTAMGEDEDYILLDEVVVYGESWEDDDFYVWIPDYWDDYDDYYDDDDTYDDDWLYQDYNGDGYTDVGVPASATTVNVDVEGPKVDPKTENKCFDLNQSATLTIFVQQPNPHTRDVMGTNQVGHAFIGIEQGGVTRYYGFYPDSPAASLLGSQDGEIHDNSGTMYNVSITVNMTATQLKNVVNYANNAPGDDKYNLKTNNCADFAIQCASKGGLTLPQTVGSSGLFSGHNPGDLGEDIRGMSAPAGGSIDKTGGNAPSKSGGC